MIIKNLMQPFLYLFKPVFSLRIYVGFFRVFFTLICLHLIFSLRVEAASPSILYLTWIHDPTTTMTIQWITKEEESNSLIDFRKVGESNWQESEGLYHALYKTDLLVHTVELKALEPDSEYEFRVKKNEDVYRFSTMPQTLSHPVKFVIGGDAYHSLERFQKMNKEIAKQSPDFVVVGGDIAYAHSAKNLFQGREGQIKRWLKFLKEWKSDLITPEGRLIPFFPVLGNHDIRGVGLKIRQQTPLFYELFALPQKSIPYRCMNFGNYMSLFLLDSGHHFHIAGQQTNWLEAELEENKNIPYKFAAYHISAYPAVYPFNGDTPIQLRKYWCPLFEQYHLKAAFEHHNHAYKRTFPLKNNAIDTEGVIYMGDGSWGVNPRSPKKLWYLEKAAEMNAVCLITLTEKSARIEALNNKGKIFDFVNISP